MMRRRKAVMRLMAFGLIYPLTACGDKKHLSGLFMKSEAVFNVTVINYLNRPIFEVLLDGTEVGAAGPYGGGAGAMVGVTVPLGQQTLSWRLGGPRGAKYNGDTITAKNSLSLTSEQISSEDRYLGIHIYPDETAELTLTQYLPEPTEKGNRIYKENGINGW